MSEEASTAPAEADAFAEALRSNALWRAWTDQFTEEDFNRNPELKAAVERLERLIAEARQK